MVSKVAVIALVAIISVPILLGYAMNLTEETVTDYEPTGDPINVSQLLQTGTQYNYVNADLNSLNTHFKQGGGTTKATVEPNYAVTQTKTSKSIFQYNFSSGQYDQARVTCSSFDYYYQQSNYSGSGGHLILTTYNPDNSVMGTFVNVHSYYFDKASMKLSISFYYPSNQYEALNSQEITMWSDACSFQASDSGGYNSSGYIQLSDPVTYNYVDFAKGYKISGIVNSNRNTLLTNNAVRINLPQYTRNTMLTVDLNTITDANYTFIILVDDTWTYSYMGFVKTTDSGGVHWGLYKHHIVGGQDVVFDELVADLYYDSTRSSNTYQILMTTSGAEIRYVGSWPTIMGPANYYQSYDFTWSYNRVYESLQHVSIASNSPKMRVDSAEYRGFESAVIEDATYTPASFKTNPATTIDAVYTFGKSLSFGGNTYAVKDGNITMGTHKIPVKGMVLDSVPNDGGGFDNRINGTIISNTVAPSTITFNGQWSASIITEEQEQVTFTKTEWVAGSFGWDGIDKNFLMVGLLASLGAFIALGVYARGARTSIWPLMLVCGGAALLFFVML